MIALLLNFTLALAAAPDDSAVLATVNGAPVTAEALQQAAARATPADGVSLSAAEREALLQQLVQDQLLYQRALAKGLDKDPKVQKVMVNLLLREELFSQVRNEDWSDATLKAYFNAHREKFIVPEKFQIRQITIKVNATRTAQDARKRLLALRAEILAAPERMKELASAESEDPYRARGGDLGYVTREGKAGLDPRVIETATQLKQGEVSQPFEVQGGLCLIRVEARREAVSRDFEQMKASVLRVVKNERYQELMTAYLADLEREADVTLNRAALAELPLTPRSAAAPEGVDLEEELEQEEGP